MFDKFIPWKKQGNGLAVQNEDQPIARLREDFDRLWDRFLDDWRNLALNPMDGSRWFDSSIDFDDNENEYVLRAELPGFEPENFDVKVSGDVLTLRAQHQEESETDRGNGQYRRYGSFYESIVLPQDVRADQIEARYHSGVLEVHLPKDEQRKPKRIEVKSA